MNIKKETVGDRLQKFAEYLNISVNRMEIDNGFYRGYVTKAKTLSAEFEKNLRKNYPKLNIDWIITGDGPMVLQPEGGNQTACTPQTDRLHL